MVSFIGFDSREFTRESIKKDGSKGYFESVIGAGVKTDDFEGFDKSYTEALEYALKQSGIEPDYKYYCVNDVPKSKLDVFLEHFVKKISPQIEQVNLFYSLFSEKQLKFIKVYGRMSKRLNIKLSEPTRTRSELHSSHIVQCFPGICAWRISEFFTPKSVQFHFDFYQGHIFEAQEELEKFTVLTYPNGDCSNPLISTSDLLVALLDRRLEKSGKPLLFENMRPTLPEFGERLKVYPILNQHLPKITPLDTTSIDLHSKLKRPVFWVFKTDSLITNDFIKKSKPYRNFIDFAAIQGGVVKLFDRKNDEKFIKEGDYGVYHNSIGKETIESYNKLGKSLKPLAIDLMVPKRNRGI